MGFDINEWSARAVIRWMTWRNGDYIGSDSAGNRYFQSRRAGRNGRTRRWVVYNGVSDASRVPPGWHAWLHHQKVAPPTAEQSAERRPWQKDHVPNMTGTTAAYQPPGAITAGGVRPRATGDYEPWTPG